MPVTNTLEAASGGDLHLDAKAQGRVLGALQRVAFDVVSSVGDTVAITTVQATCYPSPGQKYRVRGAYATASTVTGAATFDVYNTEGTPASILSAAKAFGSADAIVAGVVADQTKVYPAGYPLTLRVTTAASTWALANLRGFLEIETFPS